MFSTYLFHFLILFITTTTQTQVYVSPSGSLNPDGSQNNPYGSIQDALQTFEFTEVVLLSGTYGPQSIPSISIESLLILSNTNSTLSSVTSSTKIWTTVQFSGINFDKATISVLSLSITNCSFSGETNFKLNEVRGVTLKITNSIFSNYRNYAHYKDYDITHSTFNNPLPNDSNFLLEVFTLYTEKDSSVTFSNVTLVKTQEYNGAVVITPDSIFPSGPLPLRSLNITNIAAKCLNSSRDYWEMSYTFFRVSSQLVAKETMLACKGNTFSDCTVGKEDCPGSLEYDLCEDGICSCMACMNSMCDEIPDVGWLEENWREILGGLGGLVLLFCCLGLLLKIAKSRQNSYKSY